MTGSRVPAAVSGLRIAPGEVSGRMVGPGGRRRVLIQVAPLAGSAWDGIVLALAADPGLGAALLEGELPAALETASGSRPLRPSPGDLRWECGCAGWGGRCAHVRAVWREAQEELERNPALVLTLRGRDPLRLLADASRLAAHRARAQDAGVSAAAAYGGAARGRPAPPAVPIPSAALRPDFGLEPDALPTQRLQDQAADAAGRALDILRGTGDGALDLDRESDLARIAATLTRPTDLDHLAWRAGLSPAALRRLVRFWQSARRAAAAPATPPAGPRRPLVVPAPDECRPAPQQLSLFTLVGTGRAL